MASFGGDRLPFNIVSLIENTSNKLENLIFIDSNWRYRLTTSAHSNPLHLDTCTNNYTLKTLELYSGEVSSSSLGYIITKLMGLKILDIEAYKLVTGETPSDEVFGELTAALQARKVAGVLNIGYTLLIIDSHIVPDLVTDEATFFGVYFKQQK